MARITITVSFNEEKHAKQIAWIKNHKRGISVAVREAIDAQIERDYTLADVMQRLDDIERRGIAIAQTQHSDNGDEPIEAVLALDGLGR